MLNPSTLTALRELVTPTIGALLIVQLLALGAALILRGVSRTVVD